MTKVLVTGGGGYVGNVLCRHLLDNGYKVSVIDNLVNGHESLIPKKAEFLNCDIGDQSKVSSFLEKNKFDLVIHFAGFTRVGESAKEPEKYYDNNFEKPKTFFNCCLDHGLNKIIFSSTGSIYGNVNKKIHEDFKPNPTKSDKSFFDKLKDFI